MPVTSENMKKFLDKCKTTKPPAKPDNAETEIGQEEKKQAETGGTTIEEQEDKDEGSDCPTPDSAKSEQAVLAPDVPDECPNADVAERGSTGSPDKDGDGDKSKTVDANPVSDSDPEAGETSITMKQLEVSKTFVDMQCTIK